MKHLTHIYDFNVDQIDTLIGVAKDIMQNQGKYLDALRGRVLATLFYEPSTRTKFSFEAAMQRLGGSVIGFAGADTTSVVKGESLKDTIRTISGYANVIVMRHFQEGVPMEAARHSHVPLINAGDGKNQHPTQTLTDLLTISSELGRLDNLTIVMEGDLKHGRTVHSLAEAMMRYKGNHFVFVSPSELKMPEDVLKELDEAGSTYEVTDDFEAAIKVADVLYMTRLQKERFEDPQEYERLKDRYILDTEKMKLAKEKMIIMHPLPRVNEITEEVDDDRRAKYFEQAKYGLFMRMSLILTLVKESEEDLCF